MRLAGFIFSLLATLVVTANQASAVSLIRDAEIEATLRRIAGPILRAANLSPANVRIMIVDSNEMNAFVTGRNVMFINSGMIMRLDTVPKIQSVIAHEAAHIASGHIIALNTGNTGNSAAAIGVVLAGVAALSGRGDAALALAGSGSRIAARTKLAHSRAAEASADQGSVRFLARAGVDPQAALDTLSLFRGQEVLSEAHVDPYTRTHPLTSQRMAYLQDAVARARVAKVKPDPNLDYWHARMVAKFEGFVLNPRTILRRIPKSAKNELAIYSRAIANHRMSKLSEARRDLARLLKMRPNDPYYNELNGQFLLETGDANGAVSAYRRAAQLSKNDPLILAGLGRALLAQDTQKSAKEAITILEKARQNSFANARLYQSLAMAYGKLGRNGHASLAVANRSALTGRLSDATMHAKRAMALLPQGTPAWRQAKDIVTAAQAASRSN